MLRAAIVEADYVYSEYLNGLLLRWAGGRAELIGPDGRNTCIEKAAGDRISESAGFDVGVFG